LLDINQSNLDKLLSGLNFNKINKINASDIHILDSIK